LYLPSHLIDRVKQFEDPLSMSPFKQKHGPVPALVAPSQVERLVHVAHKVGEEADGNVSVGQLSLGGA
jgi:hypothetical protein